MLEEEGGPACFHGPVGDLGYLELGIGFGGDTDQLALAFE
jgi:hypothetical protein